MDAGEVTAVDRRQGFQLSTDDGAVLYGEVLWPEVPWAGAAIPVVVLCHCWTGRRQTWNRVASRLLEAGRVVVVYDQRGHGVSSAWPDNRSIARLSADLRQVLDVALPMVGEGVDAGFPVYDRVVLVGHSLGGTVVLQRAIDGDPRIAGMVLVSTSSAYLPRFLRRIGRRVAMLVFTSWVLQRFNRSRFGVFGVRPTFGRHPAKSDMLDTFHSLRAIKPEVVADQLAAILDVDLRAQLGSVNIPTAVLVGRLDVLTPVRHARRLQRGIPASTLGVLPGAGHMLPYERADRVADEVIRVVDRRIS